MKTKNLVCCKNRRFRRLGVLSTLFVAVVASANAAFAQPPRDAFAPPQANGPQGRPDRGGRRPGGENGAPGADRAVAPEKPEISLDEALASGTANAPILLNQRNFTTVDGVRLVANFYKGRADSDAVPVILLHDRDGNKEQYEALAKLLASQGCAVLVPDLRGCGGSVERIVADYSRGNVPTRRKNSEYLMKNFTNDDLRAMIEYDKALWFEFLVYLHNKEMLNVKKTVIVGAGLGAALAAAWAKNDWLGKDDFDQNVVGLALLSPDATSDSGKFNALPALEAIRKRVKGDLFGYVVFVGSMDETKFDAAKEIQKKIGGKKDEALPTEEKVVPIVALKTETQGTELLAIESFGVALTIQQFIAKRMQDLPKKRQIWEKIKVD